MHFLYILYSEKFDLFYVGQTHDMAQRVERHNNHIYKGAFTKIDENWKSVLELQLENKTQALFLERFIKRMKSKVFIRKIIENTKILMEILEQNK